MKLLDFIDNSYAIALSNAFTFVAIGIESTVSNLYYSISVFKSKMSLLLLQRFTVLVQEYQMGVNF